MSDVFELPARHTTASEPVDVRGAVDRSLQAESAVLKQRARAELLSEALRDLLQARDPDAIARNLFAKVAAHLKVDTFFNYMLNPEGTGLLLHACAGVDDKTAREIRNLQFGQAICGTVAQTRQAIVAHDIQNSDYDKAALVRSFGIQAYACNPLMIGDRLLGTLSFASRTRAHFEPDELEFLREVSRYTAITMDRLRTEEALRRANEELESRVQQRTQDLMKQIAETRRAEDSLRALTERLFKVQDEERRHIARELHDSTAQVLAALSMNLALLGSSKPRSAQFEKSLHESRELLDGLTREVRTMSYLLHPPLLDEIGLASAVHWYAGGFAERSGIPVHCEMDDNLGRLPSEMEVALFRIVQEGLTNVHRHAGSPSAQIRIARTRDSVTLEIRDRGVGMPPDRRLEVASGKSGMGLSSVRERVRQLGGIFQITSEQPQGTCLSVTLPANGLPGTAV